MIDETAKEIREMQTHSSSVVAVKAARALAALLDREFGSLEDYVRAVERNSSTLRGANPSHASLWSTQNEIVEAVKTGEADSVEGAKELTAEAIDRVVEAVETGKRLAAERTAETIDEGDVLLTHDYSTTVLDGIRMATEAGAALTVYVTEARPRFLGRKTARALAGIDGVDARLVVDSAAGYYLPECDRVLVGMDCIVEDTLYTGVGTSPLAATAADVGVPVDVAGSSAKLVAGGFRFQNDFRSASEVTLEPPDGFAVLNPAYDATPTRLLRQVITDEGIETL